MKNDVVYILGNGSDWNNNELRYSLRSLERYFDYGKVFIVGVCPTWLQNVIHIPVTESFAGSAEGKLKNAIHKIRIACKDERISEKFVLMNDDFYFLQPCSDIKPFSLGTIAEMLDSHTTKNGYYYTALQDTLSFLQKAGIKNPVSYGMHYPMIYEKEKFLKITTGLDWLEKGYSCRTIYGNVFDIGSIKRKDTKVHSLSTLQEFLQTAELWDFLSTSDHVVQYAQFQEWIENKFPEQSRYERPKTKRRLRTHSDKLLSFNKNSK